MLHAFICQPAVLAIWSHQAPCFAPPVQEVARCTGSLQVAQQQGAELRTERDELKTRCGLSKGMHASACCFVC